MKQLKWVGSSRKDLLALPEHVQDEFGYTLYLVQEGDKPDNVKPLKGFGSANVLEISERYDGGAYRAIFTVRFEEAIYVLHCFQKKATSGISTPKQDIDLVKTRLKEAEMAHKRWKTSNQ